jgi:HPr kinase/phosphorylase
MTEADNGVAVCLHHGTCIALGPHGILIRGPSGAGKSDLALRLIDAPGCGTGAIVLHASLIADDQVQIRRIDDCLMAKAPARLRGLMEIRGLGIVNADCEPEVRLAMVVDLAPRASIERLPTEAGEAVLLGVRLPLIRIDATSASAPARLRAGLAALVAPVEVSSSSAVRSGL